MSSIAVQMTLYVRMGFETRTTCKCLKPIVRVSEGLNRQYRPFS